MVDGAVWTFLVRLSYIYDDTRNWRVAGVHCQCIIGIS